MKTLPIVALMLLATLAASPGIASPANEPCDFPVDAPSAIPERTLAYMQEACNAAIPDLPQRDDIFASAYAEVVCGTDPGPYGDPNVRTISAAAHAAVWTRYEAVLGSYSTFAKTKAGSDVGPTAQDGYSGNWAPGWHGSVHSYAFDSWDMNDYADGAKAYGEAVADASVTVYVGMAVGSDLDYASPGSVICLRR